MLSGFSHHHDNPVGGGASRADDYRTLTDYMDAPWVMKTITGARIRVDRAPVPEILLGRAGVLRRQIASLPFQRRYRFGLLSFAEDDIDVPAFNAGHPRLRREVDLALNLFLEALWPGIPTTARPMPYVTTHTHTGRLEVNLAMPRAVYLGQKVYSHNPDPPVRLGEAPIYWRAFRDLVNYSFGWADPEDPARRMDFVRPHWEVKLLAEEARAGLTPPANLRDQAMNALWRAVQDGEVFSRHDVIAVLEAHLAPDGWCVLSTREKSITIGAPQAPVKDRLRLQGWYFDANFDGRPEVLDPEVVLRAKARRMAELATAPARFQAAWAHRAAYNRTRYSGDRWPEPVWSVDAWLGLDRTDAPQLIPRQHHLLALSPLTQKTEPTQDDTFDLGPAIPRHDGQDRADAKRHDGGDHPQTGGGGKAEHRTWEKVGESGNSDRASGHGLVLLEQFARAISGPIGLVAAIGHITRRLRDLTVRAGMALAGSRFTYVITPSRLARFTHLATRLETLNARYDIQPAADGRADAGHLNAPSGHQGIGGQLAGDGPRSPDPTGGDGDIPRPDRSSTRNHRGKGGKDSSDPGRPDDSPTVTHNRPAKTGPAVAEIRDHQPTLGGSDRLAPHPSPGPSVDRASLGVLLRAGRDLTRILCVEGTASIDRIDHGFAFRAPGATLALLDDRVLVIRWARPRDQMDMAYEILGQILGTDFPIEDARRDLAPKVPDRSRPTGRPKEHAVAETMSTVSEEQMTTDQVEDQESTQSSKEDDEVGPGM